MTKPNLQEILCCMGQPPGAIPYQYVVGKAILAAGFDWRFLTLDVSPDQLDAALAGLEAMGFCGGSLYDPHDAGAVEYLDHVTDLAAAIGQVNLIYRKQEGKQSRLVGDNSIGTACVQLLTSQTSLAERRLVVVGSNLEARAVALTAAPEVGQLVIVSADPTHGATLVADINGRADSEVARFVPVEESTEIVDGAAAVVLTSLCTNEDSESPPLDLSELKAETVVADMCFNPPETASLSIAKKVGCPTINGLDFLLQRFAHAFRVWSGQEPDLRVMREALEEYLMV